MMKVIFLMQRKGFQCLGFSFIEVLVSFFISSIAVLGILKGSIEILHAEKHAYYTHQAINQIENISERFRANTSDTFREREFSIWNQQNSELLPEGYGQYQCHDHICIFWIFWHEKQPQCIRLEILL
jgi:Tfp pilus assembly protein PilV